jgi:hypothetical protein
LARHIPRAIVIETRFYLPDGQLWVHAVHAEGEHAFGTVLHLAPANADWPQSFENYSGQSSPLRGVTAHQKRGDQIVHQSDYRLAISTLGVAR